MFYLAEKKIKNQRKYLNGLSFTLENRKENVRDTLFRFIIYMSDYGEPSLPKGFLAQIDTKGLK